MWNDCGEYRDYCGRCSMPAPDFVVESVTVRYVRFNIKTHTNYCIDRNFPSLEAAHVKISEWNRKGRGVWQYWI